MCSPAVAVAAITLVTGAYLANAQRQAGKYEAEVAEQNAKVAGLQAEQAKQTGNIEEERARMRVRQLLASQRATFAANNVDMATGTPLDVLGDTAGFGFADAAQIRSNALREAWGYQAEGSNYKSKAKAARYAGRTGGIGTLLTSGSQALGSYASLGGSFGGAGSSASSAGSGSYGPYASGYRYPGGG